MKRKFLEKLKNMNMKTKQLVALGICLSLLVVAIVLNSNVDEASASKSDNSDVIISESGDALDVSGSDITDEGMGVLKVQDADEYFAALRLNKINERSDLEDTCNNIIESDSVEESSVADAVAKMQELEHIEDMETSAETAVAARGYSDVFVRIENELVYITVLAESIDENEASAIASAVMEKTGVGIDDVILKGVY